jgi:hypothetical protein
MSKIGHWFGQNRLAPVDSGVRAAAAWKRIQDKPAEIVIRRGSSDLDAQTVRIEFSTFQRTIQGAGEASEVELVVFGVRDHPDTFVLDTDMATDDRFRYKGENYEIYDVINLPGEVQAMAKRLT